MQRVNRHLKDTDLLPLFILGVVVACSVAALAESVLTDRPRDASAAAAGVRCER